MTKKTIKIIIYISALIILGIGIGILFILGNTYSEIFEEGTEMTGVICGVFFGVLMLLYFVIQITKRNYYPVSLKKQVIFATRQMVIYHAALSLMGLSFLVIHVSFAIKSGGWSFHDFLTKFDSVTGYICIILIILSVICGLLVKINRKIFRNLHIRFAFLSLVPLIIHVLD
ncbi:MAG: hypothetical protein PF513_06215 [Tenericutes bacterium]|jgi:hypothetical protein|nr:hypothetical protein [Mycoplasmatota bacterium]